MRVVAESLCDVRHCEILIQFLGFGVVCVDRRILIASAVEDHRLDDHYMVEKRGKKWLSKV